MYFNSNKDFVNYLIIAHGVKTNSDLETRRRKLDNCHLIIGNESVDMDSVVCTIVLAIEYEGIPVVQCTRVELEKKKDIMWALDRNCITLDCFLFSDELSVLDAKNITTSLVDHNQSNLINCHIDTIIDHHEVGGSISCDKLFIRVPVGSCSSVLADFFDYQLDTFCINLLMNAVLLDTLNGDSPFGKLTYTDNELLCRWDKERREEVFNTLFKLRNDQSSLTVKECLANDYKQHKVVGISMVREPLTSFSERDNFATDVDEFIKEKNLFHLIIMTLYSDNGYYREIAFVKNMCVCDIVDFITDGGIEMTEIYEDSNIIIFNQHDLHVSRKQILPLMIKYTE